MKRRREVVDEATRWGPCAAKPGPHLGVFWGLWAPPELGFEMAAASNIFWRKVLMFR